MRSPFVTTITPTRTSGSLAYSDSDAVGTVMTVPFERRNGCVESVIVIDHDAQSMPLRLFLFESAPTATATDNSAYAPATADANNLFAVIQLASSDYVTVSGSSIGTAPLAVDIPFHLKGGSMYVQLVSGSVPSYATTLNPKVKLTIGTE